MNLFFRLSERPKKKMKIKSVFFDDTILFYCSRCHQAKRKVSQGRTAQALQAAVYDRDADPVLLCFHVLVTINVTFIFMAVLMYLTGYIV